LLVDDIEIEEPQPDRYQNLRLAIRGIAETALGPQVRLIAGLFMMAVFLVWLKVAYPTLPTMMVDGVHQMVNALHTGTFQPRANSRIVTQRSEGTLTTEDSTVRDANDTAAQVTHLSTEGRQQLVKTERNIFLLLASWRGGLAGALLVLSSLFRKPRVGPIMLGSVLLILIVGRYVMIPMGNWIEPKNVGMAVGTLVAIAAFVLGFDRPQRRARPLKPEIADVNSPN